MIGLQDIGIGVFAGDNTGDPARTAFDKINQNNATLEAAIEDAERKAFTIALTDENETISARLGVLGDDDLMTFRIPYAFVLLEVRAEVKDPDTGNDVILDILEEGYSVLDTNGLIIPAGETTSVGQTNDPLLGTVLLEDNNRITIQHVSSASDCNATGLKVTLLGYVIWVTA
jgi:hypothetical protein